MTKQIAQAIAGLVVKWSEREGLNNV